MSRRRTWRTANRRARRAAAPRRPVFKLLPPDPMLNVFRDYQRAVVARLQEAFGGRIPVVERSFSDKFVLVKNIGPAMATAIIGPALPGLTGGAGWTRIAMRTQPDGFGGMRTSFYSEPMGESDAPENR